tara:strand:- start:119 stop:307 length:189 start_codon:yes stop_codon:yes gene_type:complete
MKVYLTKSQIKTIRLNLGRADDLASELVDDWKRDKVNDKKCERIRKRLHQAVYEHKKKSTNK